MRIVVAGDDEETVRQVLVVDDDPDVNRLVALRLSARGFEVETALSGEAALRRIAKAPPDLMFLDVSMPGMSGLDVLRRVRAEQQDVGVVMMTALGSEEVAIEALRHGADDYLRKPFEPREFQTVLSRTVTRLELQRRNARLRQQLEEERRQLESELSRAARVQTDLLPHQAPLLPGFDLAAQCLPAREVGGDFYDWFEPSPGSLTLTVGDVMGKGMPAALLMATTRAVLKAAAGQNRPADAVGLAARTLAPDFERSGSFVTLFHARLDVPVRRLDYVDAGHGHGFVRRTNGTVELFPSGGFPLGIFSDQTYEEGSVTLSPGDVVVMYSDGLVEVWLDERLDPSSVAARLHGVTSASDAVQRLIRPAERTRPYPDDLTVMALFCHP